jgi:uncharacterized 2Fe-2S/4Fe-4S cluster protein (DUF4445 family)
VSVEVRFHPSGLRLRVEAGTRLLDAARRAGLPVASGCGAEGLCGRCGLHVLAGVLHLSAEEPAEAAAKRRNRIAPELRLACRAGVSGDVEVTASYW